MKYAIVEDGGKQYRAVEGGTIEVDLYPSEVGDQIDLERVLLVADGDDIIHRYADMPGARVQATVVSQVKGPKIVVFKYKPKIRYRVKKGHRQQYTRLQIERYSVGCRNGIGGRNGSQKRWRLQPQWTRQQSQRLGVKVFGGQQCSLWQYPCPPARDAHQARPQCEGRQR
jgi:large subunit ribosomal protein L21